MIFGPIFLLYDECDYPYIANNKYFLINANACFSCCYPMTTFSMKPFSECMLNRLLWQTFLFIVQDLKADSTLSSDFNAVVFIFKWYIIKHIFPWYSWTSNCSHSQPSIFAVGSNIMIWICVLSKLIAIFHEWDSRMSNIISDSFDHILPEIDMPLIWRCALMKHTFVSSKHSDCVRMINNHSFYGVSWVGVNYVFKAYSF